MYAIDIGGTNFRVMYVHLADGKSQVVSTGRLWLQARLWYSFPVHASRRVSFCLLPWCFPLPHFFIARAHCTLHMPLRQLKSHWQPVSYSSVILTLHPPPPPVCLSQDQQQIHQVAIPSDVYTGTGRQLFDFLAKSILEFMAKHEGCSK